MFDPPLQIAWFGDDPYTGGVYLLQKDGAVFGLRGAIYYGGANGQSWFAGREAAKLIFPGDPDWPQGWTYKYVIVATSGEKYGRP
jgi:hypothetical protein